MGGRALKTVAAVLLAVLPAACSKRIDMRLSGSLTQPVATVVNLNSDRAARACIDRVVVSEFGPDGRPHEVWNIESADSECLILSRLTYGETPQGFVTKVEPELLQEGVGYDWFAHGWTRGMPNIPWGGGGKFIYRDGRWHESSRQID